MNGTRALPVTRVLFTHRQRKQTKGNKLTQFERNAFAADYAAMLAISDQRKVDNKAAQVRAMQNAELCSKLLDQASRRGESSINWRGYFQNSGIA